MCVVLYVCSNVGEGTCTLKLTMVVFEGTFKTNDDSMFFLYMREEERRGEKVPPPPQPGGPRGYGGRPKRTAPRRVGGRGNRKFIGGRL